MFKYTLYNIDLEVFFVASVRFNVTFSPDVFERVNSYCKSSGIPRSAFLQLAAGQYLDAVDAMPSVNKMLSAMSAIVDGTFKGEISPDVAKERLDAISASYKALTGNEI